MTDRPFCIFIPSKSGVWRILCNARAPRDEFKAPTMLNATVGRGIFSYAKASRRFQSLYTHILHSHSCAYVLLCLYILIQFDFKAQKGFLPTLLPRVSLDKIDDMCPAMIL